MYIDGEFRISDLEFRIVVYPKPGPGVLISASAEGRLLIARSLFDYFTDWIRYANQRSSISE
jgi:hypothetical protein